MSDKYNFKKIAILDYEIHQKKKKKEDYSDKNIDRSDLVTASQFILFPVGVETIKP